MMLCDLLFEILSRRYFQFLKSAPNLLASYSSMSSYSFLDVSYVFFFLRHKPHFSHLISSLCMPRSGSPAMYGHMLKTRKKQFAALKSGKKME